MRSLLAAALLLIAVPAFAEQASTFAEQPPAVGALTAEDIATARRLLTGGQVGETRVYDAACCKVCKKGQPCGDSCISREKQCRKGPGCAC